MLKALARWILREDAPKTQPQPHKAVEDWVSREDFESAIQKLEQRIEWDLSEWYDKFSTLHARTAKRAQRASPQGQQERTAVEQEQREPKPSALHYRKPWSV